METPGLDRLFELAALSSDPQLARAAGVAKMELDVFAVRMTAKITLWTIERIGLRIVCGVLVIAFIFCK